MEKTTNSILKSINQKKKENIWRLRCDGGSTALIGNYFKMIKQDFEIYIPDRKLEGYGPSINIFKKLINKNVSLIITVDCGTMSFEAIEYANKNKIDVIVLDHHQSEMQLPKAYSIINPNRLDDKSKLNYLCAAGVCFMTLISLNSHLRKQAWFSKIKLRTKFIKFLD